MTTIDDKVILKAVAGELRQEIRRADTNALDGRLKGLTARVVKVTRFGSGGVALRVHTEWNDAPRLFPESVSYYLAVRRDGNLGWLQPEGWPVPVGSIELAYPDTFGLVWRQVQEIVRDHGARLAADAAKEEQRQLMERERLARLHQEREQREQQRLYRAEEIRRQIAALRRELVDLGDGGTVFMVGDLTVRVNVVNDRKIQITMSCESGDRRAVAIHGLDSIEIVSVPGELTG